VRISDADPEMLRYLAERGIAPGDEFEIVDKQPFEGPISARFGDKVLVLGGKLARAMRAEVEDYARPEVRSSEAGGRATTSDAGPDGPRRSTNQDAGLDAPRR
jgi:Fe2+ transport system protein FeoA